MTRFNYGGQAVMEGVMMRGEEEWAVSVRAPSGAIVQQREALPASYRSRWLKLPFLRGLISLADGQVERFTKRFEQASDLRQQVASRAGDKARRRRERELVEIVNEQDVETIDLNEDAKS